MPRHLALPIAIVLLLAACGTRTGDPATDATRARAGIDQLGWLSGCWRGAGGEECWLAPGGGTMLGVNRGDTRGGDSPSFEFLRIVEEGGGLVYLASPGGRCPPTPFPAVEVGEGRVVFANPEHDFPQRITYWLDGEDTLRARVEAAEEGELRGFELAWQRADWDGERASAGGSGPPG